MQRHTKPIVHFAIKVPNLLTSLIGAEVEELGESGAAPYSGEH